MPMKIRRILEILFERRLSKCGADGYGGCRGAARLRPALSACLMARLISPGRWHSALKRFLGSEWIRSWGCSCLTTLPARANAKERSRYGVSCCAPQRARAVSQLRGLIKFARSGFPWEKTTKGDVAPPDFLRAALTEGNRCAAFFTESRMQFDGTTKLHRKSGFGLNQLRNR